MCGLSGYLVPKENKEGRKIAKRMLPHLLRNSESRGREASGIAYHTGKGLKVIKQKGTTKELMASEPFKKFMKSDFCPALLIAHTRTPTNGTVDHNFNNHPLLSKKYGIAVIHNGSASLEWEKKFKKYRLSRKWEVDTEIILRVLEKGSKGKKEKAVKAIKLVGEVYGGSHTCATIFSATEQKLWLWRDTNPLFFGLYKDVFFFASTKDILYDSFADLLQTRKWTIFHLPSEEESNILYALSSDDTIYEVSPKKVKAFVLPDEVITTTKVHRGGRRVRNRKEGYAGEYGFPPIFPHPSSAVPHTSSPIVEPVGDGTKLDPYEVAKIEYVSQKRLETRLKVLDARTLLSVAEQSERQAIEVELGLRKKGTSSRKVRDIVIQDIGLAKTKRLKKRGKKLRSLGLVTATEEELKELNEIRKELETRKRQL